MTHQDDAALRFITVDGIDGVGKSTQIARLIDCLNEHGRDVLQVQDPGGTAVGKELRALLLDSDLQMHRRTEAMLFMASRCELIESVIRPALAEGKTIVSDRFLLANVVYQSIGGEVDADQLWQLGQLANRGLRPDLTILLDMPAEKAFARLDRPADRMESRGVDYMEQVRQAFKDNLSRSSDQTCVINADQTVDSVAADMLAAVRPSL